MSFLRIITVTLRKGKLNHRKTHFLSLEFKKVKHSIIIGIALLVSVLMNLPRVLNLFNIVDDLGASFTPASVKDILIRFIFITVFSWMTLQFNTNWKYIFYNFGAALRTIFVVVINAFWFLLVTQIFIWSYHLFVDQVLTKPEIGLLYFIYFVLMVILVFVSGILRYQIIHQQDIMEKELLKQQSLKNELEALKNQINPHFLFNSLNSLNSLVRDNKQATTFVNKLSFMYRYILQNGSQDLVTLDEELKFLESYIYLIKTRYRERFSIEINIASKYLTEKLPALALQLLVENAVKHNEISQDNPLLVKVYIDEDAIVVENKIKPRMTLVESSGYGLVNLNKRYKMLKKDQIHISDANGFFRVKLPLNI
jgi:sensor histidine kinase YesM